MTHPSRKQKPLRRLLTHKIWRSAHRWAGVALFIPFLILAATGALLTRPDWFRNNHAWHVYAVSPSDPSRHARSDGKSLWTSRDAGSAFTEVFPPGGVQDVVDLAFAPDGALYVAQKELGLLRGQEGLWELLPLPFEPVTERLFLQRISPLSPNRMVLRTSGSVWLGERRGAQWRWKKLESFETSGFYQSLHAWHSGWRFGRAGMRVVEILGWACVLLAVTGLLLFWKTWGQRP
jgi:hypothetical protein